MALGQMRIPGAAQRAPTSRVCRSLRAPFKGALHRAVTPRKTTAFAVEAAVVEAQGAPAEALAPSNGANATTAVPSAGPQCSGETFPWTQHWYPVAVLDDLDPRKPHAIHLLGIPIALWRDAQGSWRAVEDKCPHRLAPLSEGRVESDGTLQCAYHGWQFDGRGACTHIPQLRGDAKAQAVACASRRACVRAFPVQEVHGLLWVRPDGSDAAWKEAASKPLPTNAERDLVTPDESSRYVQFGNFFARDLPVSYPTLCENILDPAHVPFAHHGVMGKRTSEKGSSTGLQTFSVEGFVCDASLSGPSGTVSFKAPCEVRYEFSGVPFVTLLYAVPTKPGWSRIFSVTLQNTKAQSKFPAALVPVLKLISSIKWLDHVTRRHPILDGDTYMLHVQERLLQQRDNDWRHGYYMPAPADGSVIATRRWFDQFGGAVPTCEPGAPLPPAMSKREVLDRYSQHTAHCSACQKGLRNVDIATAVAAAGAALAALWLVARAVVGQPLLAPATGLGLLAAVVCGGAVVALRSLREQFFFVDYVHADKH